MNHCRYLSCTKLAQVVPFAHVPALVKGYVHVVCVMAVTRDRELMMAGYMLKCSNRRRGNILAAFSTKCPCLLEIHKHTMNCLLCTRRYKFCYERVMTDRTATTAFTEPFRVQHECNICTVRVTVQMWYTLSHFPSYLQYELQTIQGRSRCLPQCSC